ncbi:MAG: two-component regulator propeller domain-containing protein [Verrucomicrobiota bacterium]
MPARAATNAATESFLIWNTQNEELLPQSSVIALTQSRDGYLWLGTMRGLVRFDGLRPEVFFEADTIISLFEDRRGGLWFGTEKAGMRYLRDGRLTSVALGEGAGGIIKSMAEDASGAVWLYAADGRLARFRNGQLENIWVVDPGNRNCRAVITDTNGQMWIGSDRVLARVVSDLQAARFELLLQTNVLAAKQDFLFASQQGGYWQFCNGRVLKCSNTQVERDLGPYPWVQTDTPITAACEDAEGNLFVGTLGNGIFRFAGSGQITHLSGAEGLNHNTILSLCVDHEGNLWAGTDGGGASRISRQRFEVQPDSWEKNVQLVCEDGRGGLWFAFNGGGLNYWKDGVLQVFDAKSGLGGVNVRALLVDRQQMVWLGGVTGGGLYQLRDGQFFPALGTESVRLKVSALYEDRAGKIWVGAEEGLFCWTGTNWQVFTTREGLSVNSVLAITEDTAGNLWIGTDGGGLNCWRDGKFAIYRQTSGGLPNDFVTALLADESGALWIGTGGGGVARLKDGNWQPFSKHEGLAGNYISYLLADDAGYLWIGSNEGLMRVAKQSLTNFTANGTAKLPVRVYRKADGLPTKECTSGSQPAACRTRAGKLWFPTTKGLVGVTPTQLAPNTNPPPVMIESVLVDGVPQNTNPLQFSWRQDVIVPAAKEVVEIHFTSLNLTAPKQARFQYQLENHSKWSEPSEMRVARFTKLPYGQYRFQVRASNEDGVWSNKPATLSIVVEPPFWKTWWFQTLLAVGLLGLVVGIVYLVSTQKLQRQLMLMRQQEALEKERARIARDLHDQLGANLTQVNLLGEMVGEDKNQPEEVASHAEQICKTARTTSDALDEIVWAANPSNDTLEGLVNYACKYAQEYLALADLRYRLDVPTELPATDIAPDLRHNVFLAFKESVNNVVKHARATEAKIRLRLDTNKFVFEIEDNGRGPSEAATKTGRNGLRNMRKRMEDIGGSFEMTPGAERGTIVRLTAPITKR